MFVYALAGFLYMAHTLAQLTFDAATLFLAHLVEPVQELLQFGKN